ncbi:propanediol utilization protein PduB [Citrobacter koseri]|nr:propanediol utilization protein PduB [Citrobacter koseri]
MADTALKSANVEVVAYSSPAHGTSFSNEAILVISGDSGAVRQAVISAVKSAKPFCRPSARRRKTIVRPTSDIREADS